MARRDRNIAKTEIYGAFRGFIQSGRAKVTVSSVVEATGMNRKTFYNHFTNQDELVAWGFRRDLLDTLLGRCDATELLDPPEDPYGFEGLPCYSRTPSGTLSLDQSLYLSDFQNTFSANRDYYRSLLRTEFSAPFCRYLVELFRGLFYEDVEYFLSGRKMPDESKRLVATFFAEGVVHHTIDAFTGLVPQIAVEEGSPVGNLAHEGMLHIVEAYQNEKSNLYFRKHRLL